jgi:hypothetical protein
LEITDKLRKERKEKMEKTFTETLRINTLGSIPPYDKRKQNSCSYISIGHINNRYGILNADGTTFLPFEYDNITVWGFGLLQLSSKGKLGLLHIQRKNEESDFSIAHLIDCEYDVVTGRQDIVVLLKKYGMPTGSFHGCSVKAYLPHPGKLTDEYDNIDIISHQYERGLLSLDRQGDNFIMSTETGEILTELKRGFTLGGYDNGESTVVQQQCGKDGRLLYIENNETKEYSFNGMAAFALTGLNADGDPQTVGFLVETNSGFKLLNDELCLMSRKVFPYLSVHTEITAYDSRNELSHFSLGMQRLRAGF